MFEKVQFSRSKQSDFVGGNPINTKTAYYKAVFKNGARYYASIGLILMMNTCSLEVETLFYRTNH